MAKIMGDAGRLHQRRGNEAPVSEGRVLLLQVVANRAADLRDLD
jgi:hypothetical protein